MKNNISFDIFTQIVQIDSPTGKENNITNFIFYYLRGKVDILKGINSVRDQKFN
jgi:di/tripeptidase